MNILLFPHYRGSSIWAKHIKYGPIFYIWYCWKYFEHVCTRSDGISKSMWRVKWHFMLLDYYNIYKHGRNPFRPMNFQSFLIYVGYNIIKYNIWFRLVSSSHNAFNFIIQWEKSWWFTSKIFTRVVVVTYNIFHVIIQFTTWKG